MEERAMNAQSRDDENDELPLEQGQLPHLVSEVEDEPDSTKVFSVVNQEVPVALEHALIRTLAMFQQHNLATAEDCNHVAETVKRNWLEGKGCDPVDCLARLSAGNGDMLDASVEAISTKLAGTLPEAPTRVPFAGRLIAPTALYEKNPYIFSICKLMRVPVAYAEDLDVLALASINPYFMDALSVSIGDYAMQHKGTQPIISNIRLDYAGWVNMCNKHFKEEVDHD
ncbi:MAG: hypothetical protein ACPIB0_02390 [Akkermansiaceae bacterium]